MGCGRLSAAAALLPTPSSRPAAKLWVVVACLLCWLWPAAAGAQFFSPGALARDHAELEGDDNCSACHSAARRVDNAKCSSCHADVARSVQEKSGLHGKAYAGKACASCHVDHRGREHELVRWDPDSFDHRQTGWPLGGDHRLVECAKCHDSKNERNQPTFIGLEKECASCHEDVHKGRFGLECQTCHDDADWKALDLRSFNHDLARYPLLGKHRQTKCAECHGEPAKYAPLEFDACGDCHQDPHQGRLGAECQSCHDESSWKKPLMQRARHPGVSLSGGHARVACKTCHDQGNSKPPAKGERCVSCHAPVHEANFGADCARCHSNVRWLGLPEALGRRVHQQTQYPLAGQHERTPCESCHSPKLPLARRYRQLEFDDCKDCHRDVHKGQFKDREGGRCESCHTLSGFAPATFDGEDHARTEFALEGGHRAAPCASCHTGPAPRLDWQLQKQACADCHENPHGSRFAREMQNGGCGTCHDIVAWDVPKIAHETWPLTGKHRGLDCNQCHDATEADQTAGAGPSYRLAPRECEGCHADVHLGQFQLSEPERGCAACHTAQTFKLPGYDHEQGTGYALDGKHAELRCAQCHPTATLADGQSTPLWRLPYDDCKDCHADPHAAPPAQRPR